MRRVALNDVMLDEIDDRILVQGIEENAARLSWSAVSRGGGAGQRVTQQRRDYLEVTVKFAIRLTKAHMTARNRIFEQVAGWAVNGGWLTVNYKPKRRLRVVCTELPTAGDQAEWNSDYEITFRAYDVPYWQQESPNTLQVNSTKSISREMAIEGTAESVLDVEFANVSGMEINTVTLTTPKSTFAFKSLGLGADETLMIDHTSKGILRIRIRSANGSYRSALAKRTEDSSDDLIVQPGQTTVTLSAQRAGRLKISCYGRYV